MDVKEKIKEILNAGCSYPGCKKKQGMTVSLALVKQLENGQIEASESMQVGVPFCMDHSFIMMSGMFAIKDTPDMKQELVGPFEIVHLVDAVISSMIMNGELQKRIKDSEEAQKQVDKIKKEMEAKKIIPKENKNGSN